MKKAVAYCRVSTKKEDQLNSLETQKNFYSEFAERQNFKLIRTYADEGLSGTKKKNRTEFNNMMEDAEKGLFDVLMVKDASRLARNTLDFIESIRNLKRKKIEVIFVTTNMSTIDTSEFTLTIFAAMAQEESSLTSTKVKFGKDANAKKGRVPNFVYGYDKTNGDYFNLTINETESTIVKRIFNLYLEEGYGANKIAMILNKDGILSKRGSKFSQNAIIRILTNPIYIGQIINKKEQVIDFLTSKREKLDEKDWIVTLKPELKIVDEEDFVRAKQILEERHKAFKSGGSRHSNAYPFSTLIKCEQCGYSFRRIAHEYADGSARWACSGRNANGVSSCPNKITISENEFLNEIRKYLMGVLSDSEKTNEKILKDFNKLYKDKHTNSLDAKAITTELNKLKRKKEKELDLYTDDIITKEELLNRTEPISQKIKELTYELELANNNLTKSDAVMKKLNEMFKNISITLSMEVMTNAMLKKIIDKITVNADGNVNIHIKYVGNVLSSEKFTFSDNQS